MQNKFDFISHAGVEAERARHHRHFTAAINNTNRAPESQIGEASSRRGGLAMAGKAGHRIPSGR